MDIYNIDELENEELLELHQLFGTKVNYLGKFDEKENETLDTFLEIEEEMEKRNLYA